MIFLEGGNFFTNVKGLMGRSVDTGIDGIGVSQTCKRSFWMISRKRVYVAFSQACAQVVMLSCVGVGHCWHLVGAVIGVLSGDLVDLKLRLGL